ncbi:DNA polymerase III subunit delta [Natronoglycomyces albus]|uniref:DNA-directed DNA polymerase n=1 Tax=Natronoglycomyces albus TaxID=2811108 RepID=A0A895XS68_9ACTN|nr:DNA polymerase III subunit delta [Natronoglycomyces albus]QSB04478.1 DNA polymerase III subunit delta [Natronoglycomyces albus]
MASIAAIRLILGDEELLAERAASEFTAAVTQEDPDAAVHRVAGGDLTSGRFTEITSPTLLGGATIAIVEDAQNVPKDVGEVVAKYASQPEPDVYLALCHAGGNKGKALAEKLRKMAESKGPSTVEMVRASKIKRAMDRTAFVRGELKAAGASPRSASADIADTIIAAVGTDLRELASACAQLVADTEGNLSIEAVGRYYQGRAEVTGFAVADAAVSGRTSEALASLRWAMQIGVDPVPLADALAMSVRSVSRVVGERGGSQQIAKSLGMAPWQIDKARKLARGWTAVGLAEAMQVCANVNADVKGGMEDRGWALERAILAIGSAREGA